MRPARRASWCGAHLGFVLLVELADQVLLEHVAGIFTVPNIVKALGGLGACRFDDDLLAARVLPVAMAWARAGNWLSVLS